MTECLRLRCADSPGQKPVSGIRAITRLGPRWASRATGKTGPEPALRLALSPSDRVASWENSWTCGSHALTQRRTAAPPDLFLWPKGGWAAFPGQGRSWSGQGSLTVRTDPAMRRQRRRPKPRQVGDPAHKATPLDTGVEDSAVGSIR